MPELWERQPAETAPSWAAFMAYRDFGAKRSTAKVAQELRKSKRLMDRWSGVHRWVDRAAAWDHELDRMNREAQAEAVIEMNTRHAGIAMSMQAAVLERLQELDPATLSPTQLTQMIAVASKLEREARGVDTDWADMPAAALDNVPEKLIDMSSDPEERDRIIELAEWLGKKQAAAS